MTASLRILFERFGLQWTFNDYTFSGQGASDIIPLIIRTGELSPWVQKNSTHKKL